MPWTSLIWARLTWTSDTQTAINLPIVFSMINTMKVQSVDFLIITVECKFLFWHWWAEIEINMECIVHFNSIKSDGIFNLYSHRNVNRRDHSLVCWECRGHQRQLETWDNLMHNRMLFCILMFTTSFCICLNLFFNVWHDQGGQSKSSEC
jgi:hypothetical protein